MADWFDVAQAQHDAEIPEDRYPNDEDGDVEEPVAEECEVCGELLGGSHRWVRGELCPNYPR